MSGKLFGYARVSTDIQNLDRQIDILVKYGVEPETFSLIRCWVPKAQDLLLTS